MFITFSHALRTQSRATAVMDSTVKIRDFAASASVPAQRRSFTPPAPLTAKPARALTVEEAPRPFQDCDLTFAVDISQSTKGTVLAEECALIKNIERNLTRRASSCIRVLPWDEISHKVISTRELDTIDPAGRTDPNVLLQNSPYLAALHSCHLWFLLTDGEILPASVRRFALNINSRSLHGTPCVLAIFGSRPATPFLCNVSVGISVFGVSPDCIFLFHDVESHHSWILQCKGCFNALLPAGQEQLFLERHTEWSELPQLDWSQLLTMVVPPTTKLDEDQLKLQSGTKIRLEDVYHDRVHSAVLSEIWSNDDNLKSMILTATTRGQGREIRDWVARRRDPLSELFELPRPDVGGNASRLVEAIIEAKTRNSPTSAKIRALCKAHAVNFKAFEASMEPLYKHAAQRSETAHGALRRIDEMEEYELSSPGGLSPVSHRPHTRRRIDQGSGLGPLSQLLFNKGYHLDCSRSSVPRIVQRCQVCERGATEVAIFLKKPPTGTPSTGFPLPQSRSRLLFPFAVARYRETDMISRLICCDPCASFVVDHGRSPYGEDLIGALIVGESLSLRADINKKTWLKAMDKAFEERIVADQLLLAILPVLYDAADHANSDPLSHQAYHHACIIIESYAQVPYEIGNPHWTATIQDVVSYYLSLGVASPQCDFLSHPIDSFVCMIRASRDIEAEQKAAAIFLRFVLHVIEYNDLLQDTERGTVAIDFMASLQHTSEEGNWTPESSSITMALLCERCVVDQDAVLAFRSVGHSFKMIEDRSKTAIVLFLCLFGRINTGCTDARQTLNWFCAKSELKSLFSNPWLIGQTDSQFMWNSLS